MASRSRSPKRVARALTRLLRSAETNCGSVVCPSSLAFFLSSLVPMAQKRARPTSSVEGFDGRDDAPEEEERVFFDDDNAEYTMSDLPVLMEIAWPSLAGGCGERPRGARFFLSSIVLFFSTFLLVGKYWGRVCGMETRSMYG